MKKFKGILFIIVTVIVIVAVYNALTPGASTGTDGSRPTTATQSTSQPMETQPVLAAAEQTTSSNVLTISNMSTPWATATPVATPDSVSLERGDKGDDVKKLQKLLNSLGFTVGSPDGIYGAKTEKAIKRLQKQAGLTATGIADSTTIAILCSENAPTAPPEAATALADNEESGGTDYILNKSTKKFHYPSCSSVDKMNESNKIYFNGTRQEAKDKGYAPCQKCNP